MLSALCWIYKKGNLGIAILFAWSPQFCLQNLKISSFDLGHAIQSYSNVQQRGDLLTPMGLTSSGDQFCAQTDRALAGIPGVFKLVDVILIVGDNVKQLMGWIKSVFERCQDHGITLSNTKFQVGSKVKFAGYVVSDKGKEPDPDKIAAIAQFPRTDNLTDLRSFMGLANQASDFHQTLGM